jgi:hypothetical protein
MLYENFSAFLIINFEIQFIISTLSIGILLEIARFNNKNIMNDTNIILFNITIR